MNNKRNIITTRFLLSIALLITAGTAARAHGGFDHVIGTVAAISGNVLTVKTAKGNVDVKLDDKTEFSKGDAKAQASDLKPGVRVIVDIPEGGKIAHSVKVGATAAPDHDAHH
jgi:hypothetical protein